MESKKEVEVELEEIAMVEEDKEKENQEKETKGKMFNKIFMIQSDSADSVIIYTHQSCFSCFFFHI